MKTFLTRKTLLTVMMTALVAIFFSFSASGSVKAGEDPCKTFHGSCDPCSFKGISECLPTPEAISVPELDTVSCTTKDTRMEVTDRNTVVVYGTAAEGTSGTLFIAEIPLSAIRNITEAERASGELIWITGLDSTIVEGWRVDIYWHNEHYGAHIVGQGGSFIDDTGATCGL